jgi:hypothetical protein
MHQKAMLGAALVAALLAGSATIAWTQVPSEAVVDTTPQKTPPYPTVGDLMNGIVQPRHAKLGLAGAAQNWPLAAHMLHALSQSFENISRVRPTWRDLSLPYMFESTVDTPLKAVGAAIDAHDPQKFKAAYARLTAACNLCHTVAQHPFIVIKVPDRSEFPNQDFRARAP